MIENRIYRLSKVAKELNVGISNIIEFLSENGYQIDRNPNSKIPEDLYYVLAYEFSTGNSKTTLLFKQIFKVFQALNAKSHNNSALIHFSTFILVDRIANNFFKSSTINELINVSSISEVFNSKNLISDYKNLLTKLNSINIFQNIFTPVLVDLDIIDSDLILNTYENAFRIISLYQKIDSNEFGKLFSEFITISGANKNTHIEGHILKNRIISNTCEIEVGDIVYNPIIGTGDTIIALAHYNNCYNFKVLGTNIENELNILCKINLILNKIFDFNIELINQFNNENKFIPADISICISAYGNSDLFNGDIKGFANQNGIEVNNEWSNTILMLMLKYTKSNGKIIATLPNNFTESNSNYNLRKYLIENNFLDLLIGLPTTGSSINSDLKSNILYLNKDKKTREVGFLNIKSNVDNISINNLLNNHSLIVNELSKDIKKVLEELNWFNINITEKNLTKINFSKFEKSSLKEESNRYEYLIDVKAYTESTLIKSSFIVENDFNLSIKRYINQVYVKIQEAKKKGEKFVCLRDILSNLNSNNNILAKSVLELPFIKMDNLNKNGGKLNYNDLNINEFSNKWENNYRIINESCLLIARVGGNLRATYFYNPLNNEVFVNNNIYSFNCNKDNLNIDYLLGQLNTQLVDQQAEIYRTNFGTKSISKENLYRIEIPFPSLVEQFEWVERNKKKDIDKDELTSFIKSIPLIETNQDLKNEIERFSKVQLNDAKTAEFKKLFEYDIFPFSDNEIENYLRYKKDKEKNVVIILLNNEEYGVIGAVEISDNGAIDIKKAQTINEYASFLIKIYDFLTKSSINKQLDSFAHTSRNFFLKLQGEISLLLDSQNDEFQKIMKSTLVASEDEINYFLKKGTKQRSDFILRNQLLSIKEQVTAQYNFYKQIHELYSEIKNASISKFEINIVLNELKNIMNNDLDLNDMPRVSVLGKQILIKHALVDLVGNAIKYSPDQRCKLEIKDKGNSIIISLSNVVNVVIDESKYNKLGQTWLKDNSDGQDRVSSGIYYAFQMIRESHGEASLVDYEYYKENKIFKVLIQLRKYD